MAKKNSFGKFLLFCTTVGAIAAGVYYYLSKREEEIADSFDDDDFDDFDDFDDDEVTTDTTFGSRKYVDITSSNESDAESEDSEDETASDSEDLDEDDAPEDSEEFFDDEDK
ncbi:MAG: hypothetical protein IKS09_01800 [Lachnospiraceae bacterium]|nr:hypothetical protein [Lachnospiraceae bacterium]